MRWKSLRLAVLFFLASSLILSPLVATQVLSEAARVPAPSPATAPAMGAASSERTRVYVGIYLHDISKLSLSDGTYEIDADLWAKWLGEFDATEIRFANASDLEFDVLDTERDGEWNSARWRVRGTMRSEFPVHDFPLDRQAVRVQVELPRSKGELVPDLAGSGVSHRFSITDWNWSPEFRPVVTTERYPSDLGSITDEGRSSEVRRVSFEVPLERPIMPVILKLFLPLAVVALIVFLSLFVPPTALQPRLTMCVTGLVACFAFQFSIADVMPTVAYLTLADVLFITVYVLAILCVLVAVLTHVWDSSGQPERAQKLQRASRILAPIAMGVAILLALPKGVAELPSTAEVSLDLPRHASARSVVRIGTTSPLRLSSSPVGAASFWGLNLRLGEGRAQPLWLTEMPRIDSKNMRFLSDGSLEVTWQLRENARWSDGSLILIEDLLRPLKERPDPRILSWNTQEDGRLTLIWQERVVDALRAPTLWPTAHLDAHVDTADQTDLRQYLGYALRPTLGPYMPIEVDDTKAVAIRNPHFPFAAANIERIELYTFEDSASLRAALLSGEIDITTPNALSPSDYAHFKAHPSLSAVETDSANFLFLAPNLTDAPWNQREARHALLQAIDRAQLVDDAWGEAGRVAHVPTTELPADLVPVDYNPDEARTTLEALGLVGQTVRLHWSTPTSEYFITQLASALEAVGLVVELERVRSSWPLWISKEYEGLLVHQQRIEQTTPMATWWALPLLDGRPDTTHRHDAWTDGTEALLTQYEYALFRERRAQLRGRIFEQWSAALPLIPLAFTGERMVLDQRLRGWERPPESAFGATMDQWYFE